MRAWLVAVLLVLATGCATTSETPSVPPPGVAASPMILPPKGTRWVMRVTAENVDTGKKQTHTLTWTALGEGLHENRPVVRVWNGSRLELRDPQTGSWAAALDRHGHETLAVEPHEGDVSSPLWVGKEWAARFTRHQRFDGRSFHDVTVVWKVEALEDVTVPAGTFKAYRLSAWPDRRDPVKKRVRWYAPDVRLVVKEVTEGLGADASQVVRDLGDAGVLVVRAGATARFTSELTSYTSPAGLLPALVGALREPTTRLAAIGDIAALGPLAHDAMPALVDILVRDASTMMRTASVTAVAAIGVRETDVDGLVPALADADTGVRAATAGLLKPHAARARAVLESRLTDQDGARRAVAVRALGGLGRVAPTEARPLLGRALEDGDPRVRVAAVQAAADLGAASDAVPVLVRALEDGDSRVRLGAVRALGEVGVHAMGALRGALRHADAGVRATAVEVIIAVPEQQPEAIKAIAELLDDPVAAVRGAAIRTLGNMGPLAIACRAPIARLAEHDPSPENRELATRALEYLRAP